MAWWAVGPRIDCQSGRQTPTTTSKFWKASPKASCAERVLLPTPPLPDKTRILCFTVLMRSLMRARSEHGTGWHPPIHKISPRHQYAQSCKQTSLKKQHRPLPDTRPFHKTQVDRDTENSPGSTAGVAGCEAHISWLGHPSQAELFPAFSVPTPGHPAHNTRRWQPSGLTLLWRTHERKCVHVHALLLKKQQETRR